MLVLIIIASLISKALDFSGERLTAAKEGEKASIPVYSLISSAIVSGAVIYIIAEIFALIQNPETGEFDITAIAGAHWLRIIIVSSVALLSFLAIKYIQKKKK